MFTMLSFWDTAVCLHFWAIFEMAARGPKRGCRSSFLLFPITKSFFQLLKVHKSEPPQKTWPATLYGPLPAILNFAQKCKQTAVSQKLSIVNKGRVAFDPSWVFTGAKWLNINIFGLFLDRRYPRHVFSDSKVHKFKIESWYVFSKLMLIYFSLICRKKSFIVKNPEFIFSSQDLSIERNFFKWDG